MDLLKKLIAFAMGNGIVLILGFISSPIITRLITIDNMGKYSMFNTLANFLLLIALFGIDQSYVRYYYEEDEKNRGVLLRKCLKIPLIASGVFSFIIIIFSNGISNYLVEEQSIFLIFALIIHLFCTIISRFALLEIRMQQRAKLYSTLNVIQKLAYLAFIGICFFAYGDNYITIILATVMGNIVMTGIALYIERNVWFKKQSNRKIKTSEEELFKYGFPLLFSAAMIWVFQSIDKVTIRAFCGFGENGLYAGAMLIVGLLNIVQQTFTTFWTPVAFEKYSTHPEDKKFFSNINKIVSIVMILGAIGLILFKDIIILFVGKNYRDAMYIFPFLVFMPIMNCISETTVIGINFKKKTRSHVTIAALSALANLIGNLILVPLYGAKGAAISTGLAYIVFFLARTIISNKYYKVDYSLGKFFISIAVTYVFAIYASFNKFNITILILAIIAVVTVILCYREIFIYGIEKIKKKLKKLSKNMKE